MEKDPGFRGSGSRPSDEALAAASIADVGRLGWRQGSVVPLQIGRYLHEAFAPERIEYTDRDRVIAVSHDCDLANAVEAVEPIAELMIVRFIPTEEFDGNFTYLKNPRRMQYWSQLGGARVLCDLTNHDRWEVPRKLLSLGAPEGSLLPTHKPQILGQWLSRRYWRTALPDEFNRRVQPALNAIATTLKRSGHDLTSIWLLLETVELDAATPYEVEVWATATDDKINVIRSRVDLQSVVDKVAADMDECDGIEVRDAQLRSEREVTLQDLDYLKRWDRYDPISLRNEPPDSLARWEQE